MKFIWEYRFFFPCLTSKRLFHDKTMFFFFKRGVIEFLLLILVFLLNLWMCWPARRAMFGLNTAVDLLHLAPNFHQKQKNPQVHVPGSTVHINCSQRQNLWLGSNNLKTVVEVSIAQLKLSNSSIFTISNSSVNGTTGLAPIQHGINVIFL